MTNADLARRVYSVARITGQFTLRSGRTATEYFDKYQFEADPVLLDEIGKDEPSRSPSEPAEQRPPDVDDRTAVRGALLRCVTSMSAWRLRERTRSMTSTPTRSAELRHSVVGSCSRVIARSPLDEQASR